ncbi:hypothetical protein KN815_49755, partial [Streptomyces sp. 4503]
MRSRSTAARQAAATVRVTVPLAATGAVVQGASTTIAHELARGKGVRTRRGSSARRLIAAVAAGRRVAVAAGTGHGGPP